jgi:hypothetical protein
MEPEPALPSSWLQTRPSPARRHTPNPPVRRANQHRLVGPDVKPNVRLAAAWKTRRHDSALASFADFQIAILRRELDGQPAVWHGNLYTAAHDGQSTTTGAGMFGREARCLCRNHTCECPRTITRRTREAIKANSSIGPRLPRAIAGRSKTCSSPRALVSSYAGP